MFGFIRKAIRREVDNYLFEKELGSLGEPATTPRTSRAGLSAADSGPWGGPLPEFERMIESVEALARETAARAGPAATNLGSRESSSPPKTPESSLSLGPSTWAHLGHVASCYWCQASPGLLRSLSKTLARGADALEEKVLQELTSVSGDMSSSAAAEPGSATSGLNQCLETLGLINGVPRRCVRELGHRGWHTGNVGLLQFVEMLP